MEPLVIVGPMQGETAEISRLRPDESVNICSSLAGPHHGTILRAARHKEHSERRAFAQQMPFVYIDAHFLFLEGADKQVFKRAAILAIDLRPDDMHALIRQELGLYVERFEHRIHFLERAVALGIDDQPRKRLSPKEQPLFEHIHRAPSLAGPGSAGNGD